MLCKIYFCFLLIICLKGTFPLCTLNSTFLSLCLNPFIRPMLVLLGLCRVGGLSGFPVSTHHVLLDTCSGLSDATYFPSYCPGCSHERGIFVSFLSSATLRVTLPICFSNWSCLHSSYVISLCPAIFLTTSQRGPNTLSIFCQIEM